MMKRLFAFGFTLISIFLYSCNSGNSSQETKSTKKEAVNFPAPAFNADSAYAYVKTQVDFGPRVPNTQGHYMCGDYLISELERLDTKVHVQEFTAEAYSREILRGRNIMGQINPDARKRVLLAAHWDTRHVADQGNEKQNEPILGANDGASGVAVLLEIARSIQQAENKPNIGVDILFFDLEDYGRPDFEDIPAGDNKTHYCLGSQYWSKNKYPEKYHAYYGILLDMVGSKGATFLKEGFSNQNASPKMVKKIWKTAQKIGYGHFFIDQEGPSLTDDHIFVTMDAGIPMVDIIHLDPTGQKTFFDHWHTHQDNMENIDPATLKAVGQTVLQMVYNEQVM